MKIHAFEFTDPNQSGWTLEKIELTDRVNLFVGITGAGKTRVLNMIWNIARYVAGGNGFCPGSWVMLFEHNEKKFTWEYSGVDNGLGDRKIQSESLKQGWDASDGEIIFNRDDSGFKFNGQPIPKLGSSTPGIFMLREEEKLKDAYNGFQLILRRNFWGGDLQNAMNLQGYPYQLLEKFKKTRRKNSQIFDAFLLSPSLHLQLFLLKQFFPEKFRLVQQQFSSVFPSVIEIAVASAAKHLPIGAAIDAPMVLIKEKGIQKSTPLHELSSGMQKVLMIITDVISSPSDIIYMIDEYENSLGVNAINFLPDFLAECGEGRQFIITTHHPMLINSLPVRDWIIFNRTGSRIKVKYGEDLADQYSNSRQQKFIQLINDPFFTE